MAVEASFVPPMSLQVGQWIQFMTDKDLSVPAARESEKRQAIYHKDQRYLVVTREDAACDPCRCRVIDIQAKKGDYCPRMNMLGCIALESYGNIRVDSRQNVEILHGKEKVQRVYDEAKKWIAETADYRAKYPTEVMVV